MTVELQRSQVEVEGAANVKDGAAKVQSMRREKLLAAVRESQEIALLPQTAVPTVEKLIDLHLRQLDVEAEYRAEWLALKAKYYRKLDPFYVQRSSILQSGAESSSGAKCHASCVVPDFWLTVLAHHPSVSSMIESRDEDILKFVTDISYSWANPDEQLDFTIVFKFAENPFFINSELTKTFKLEIDQETQDPILLRSVGTQILWKEGKDITTKTVTKKQKNKRTGETRVVKENVDKSSFFHFFDSHEVPDEDVLEGMDDEEIDALENLLDTEYEVGCILRDKIIAHAVSWFLGVEDDEDEDSSEDSGLETDDEVEDDDDDEETAAGAADGSESGVSHELSANA
eukprot:Gregarina_sp_Poly_1__2521@NODE_1683_length_3539_cov_192_490207_g1106_i0_p2_GENE_NODE_1683_length_3539_cov_192_490207_g1106_i0NODE_1683_length_3539_cov_192_490207_g1106_i0_p2_ORF_typecomplete_len344_score80_92NAP/PF00956_18/5_7e54RNA_pol_3_Rpc31/PF11705_8/6_3e02RNA_pol_3_Rpc31/PF11705_8/0_27BNIP2/PF12496_8/0_5BUD22/PF09073_10/2_4_NODE_1683_length_3539_cov_192_490207_g1106_i0831114